MCWAGLTWYTFRMTKNEVPAPRPISLVKFIAPCDGCDKMRNLQATDDGRALMCDECKTEYDKQMSE